MDVTAERQDTRASTGLVAVSASGECGKGSGAAGSQCSATIDEHAWTHLHVSCL